MYYVFYVKNAYRKCLNLSHLASGIDPKYVLVGGLEPDFRVLFSTLFHAIAQVNCR